jgi:RNA polymerase sigma factor (sigma-70 family)
MKRASRDLQALFTDGSAGGLSDSTFLERFAAERDAEAFEALVVRHGPMVWSVCRRILRDPNDAEDAFQATFLVLARKASSIARRELVANWLYAVAYKTAVRAAAMASRRRAREFQVAEIPEPEAGTDDRRDDLRQLLDQELSRLPAKYRIPVVLCELEGKSLRDAANELGCPIGTISSRLSRARGMLAQRLTRRGVSLSAGTLALLLAGEASSAPMPARLIGATARSARLFAAGGASAVVAAGIAELTRGVLKMMLVSRLKVTALLLLALAGAGLVWSGSGTFGAGPRGKPQAPRAAAIRPAKAEVPGPPKWAHLTSDFGFESWVRLEDGRTLSKRGKNAEVYDPASGTLLTYWSNGEIVRRPRIAAHKDDGSLDVEGTLGNAKVRPIDPADMRQRMAAEGRRFEDPKVVSEARVVDLDGRRCLRIDFSQTDLLGQWKLNRQEWYDIETRRPVRYRDRLGGNEVMNYGREYGTTTITYVDRGPADIHALGVPVGTPIVDEAPRNQVIPPIDGAALPPGLEEMFRSATRAIERLPRSVRVVEEDRGWPQLAYWSAPEGYLNEVAKSIRVRAPWIEAKVPPRLFFADIQGSSEVGIPPGLRTRPEDDLPADALAAWLPIEKSVNVRLIDGVRGYQLLRSFVSRGKPRKVQVFVHRVGDSDPAPEWLQEIWPFLFEDLQKLKLVPSAPGTSRGWLGMKFEEREFQRLYEADPAHGYAVARKVEWSSQDGGRTRCRTESKALRWAQLPGGAWYVTAWEQLHHCDEFDESGKPKAEPSPDDTWVRRVNITPMDPGKFPPRIFDGEKFLEAARKEGAKILVD